MIYILIGILTIVKTANIKGEFIKGFYQDEDNLKVYLDD